MESYESFLVKWKSALTNKRKCSFFQSAIVSILLYGCTTWTLTERMEKKIDGNYTRMLRAILNKSWRQYPIKQQLYGYQPPITKTQKLTPLEKLWRAHNWMYSGGPRSRGRATTGRPARTYIWELCADKECSPEDLPKAMNDRELWRERVRNIRADSATWWYIYIYIYIYIYSYLCRLHSNWPVFKVNLKWTYAVDLFMQMITCVEPTRRFRGTDGRLIHSNKGNGGFQKNHLYHKLSERHS